MKAIPFMLFSSTDGTFLTGQAENISVRISKDGTEFVNVEAVPTEFSAGYYFISVDDNLLDVVQFALIEITCPGAQLVVKQWSPEQIQSGTVTVDLESLKAYGDANWKTATGFSTFDPKRDTVTIDPEQAAMIANGTGGAILADIIEPNRP